MLRAIDVVEESNPELLCRLRPGLPAKTAADSKCKQTADIKNVNKHLIKKRKTNL